ncbi:hypothetical protein KPL35_17620 [Clostridium sp. CF011]|uniref:hypothetical protein n=1 Tax=Clostridium sp. CF011 TaxID=2843318 RepID=UPI001C0BA217|nr:hypothetical protein [Clostridium sp. CF011]MBU3093852.1 hypothetical protein [Clostridium sp. CF011]WAG71707.1 hypothetical protein LL036_18620 [Clostridium sp. CF011]
MSIKVIRTRKEFRLLNEDINYINIISKENNLQPSDALSQIINEHESMSNILENSLKKILLGINNLNKLSKIQLEISNSICLKEGYQEKDFVSTTEFKSGLVAKAYEEVEKQIANSNIKKSSK